MSTWTVPPQLRPTSKACSSEMPKVRSRGVPDASTSWDSWIMAGSMHPPDKEPVTRPSLSTTMAAPAPRGARRSTFTTVDSTKDRPWERVSMTVGKTVLTERSPPSSMILASRRHTLALPVGPARITAVLGGAFLFPSEKEKSLRLAGGIRDVGGAPTGIRTPVSGLRTLHPRPLDDGGLWLGGEDSNLHY